VTISGVVLQSSILNYNSNCGVVMPLVPCTGFVPSYGATGAWYGRDSPNPSPAELPAFVAQMRTLAAGQYDPAVIAFLTMATPPPAPLLQQLVATTGMSLGGWQSHFNMGPDFYQFNLIPGTLIGLYDARVSAPMGSALAAEGDPSSTFINASFATTITSYLNTQLQYSNPSSYVLLSNAIQSWNYSHDGQVLPDTIPDLAAALAQNPQLHVLSVNGYHDLVTPFFQTERDLARIGPTPNVQERFYPGGHMTYLDDGSRVLEKADLVQFYQNALAAP
jgi:carboxypeptidase C (cathepsin A)